MQQKQQTNNFVVKIRQHSDQNVIFTYTHKQKLTKEIERKLTTTTIIITTKLLFQFFADCGRIFLNHFNHFRLISAIVGARLLIMPQRTIGF